MKGRRITINRWLGLTAILAVNLAWFRGVGDRSLIEGLDLVFVALQVGLWCLLRSRGRPRRFWAGFVAVHSAAALALPLCGPLLLDGPLAPYYSDVVDYLEVTYLPGKLAGMLGGELWGVHLDVLYFVPAFAVALLGGMIAAGTFPRRLATARSTKRGDSTATVDEGPDRVRTAVQGL
jgi:hypothetical protein